jgi:hypothetical protein
MKRNRALTLLVLVSLGLCACESQETKQERIHAKFDAINRNLERQNEAIEIDSIGTCEEILRLKASDKACRALICSAAPKLSAKYGVNYQAQLRRDGIKLNCPAGTHTH